MIKLLHRGKDIGDYAIVLNGGCSEAESYAATELIKYVKRATGRTIGLSSHELSGGGLIRFVRGDKGRYTEDGFRIYEKDGSLVFEYGGGRGAIYAVYTFLEKAAGFRFIAQALAIRGFEKGTYLKAVERLAEEGDIEVEKRLPIEEIPVFFYRDAASHALVDEEWCAKQKLNGETWKRKYMDEYLGGNGDVRFANPGGGGHTFQHLVPVKEYGRTNPEFFAEIDGKRITEGSNWSEYPQPCLTNEDLIPLIVNKLKECLRKRPDHKMISVSQNDNMLFCRCEKCRKSYEKYGMFGTIINFVNGIARELEKDYPDKLVHTYCYWGATDVSEKTPKAHKNVLVQYCTSKMCRSHRLDDPKCPINSKVLGKLKKLSEVADNIFIYEYNGCLKYSMLMLPDIDNLRANMRVFAEHNVKGIYSELCIHAAMQPTMEELRAYLFSKLAWNPYMSEEEYDGHINEFLRLFYGKGWKYLREYIDSWNKICDDVHLTSGLAPIVDENLNYVKRDGKVVYAELFNKSKVRQYSAYANELFDKAAALAIGDEKQRIEIARTAVIWYELFHTMEDILNSGTEEEKRQVIQRNRDLCSRMRKYCMKYTTYIGMEPTTRMFEDFSLPPSKWNYTRDVAGVGLVDLL